MGSVAGRPGRWKKGRHQSTSVYLFCFLQSLTLAVASSIVPAYPYSLWVLVASSPCVFACLVILAAPALLIFVALLLFSPLNHFKLIPHIKHSLLKHLARAIRYNGLSKPLPWARRSGECGMLVGDEWSWAYFSRKMGWNQESWVINSRGRPESKPHNQTD